MHQSECHKILTVNVFCSNLRLDLIGLMDEAYMGILSRYRSDGDRRVGGWALKALRAASSAGRRWLGGVPSVLMVLLLASCDDPKQIVICYNCGASWGAWGSIFRAFERKTGIVVPSDSRNSGQALAAALAERAHPIADVLYLGGQAGIQAKTLRLTVAYRPPGFDQIPTALKDPDGHWFAVHDGTIGFFVNVAALGGLPVPRSWHDLLNPRYRGMIGYFDPAAAAGFVTGMAVNLALGGDYANLKPGLDYFTALRKNQPLVVKQTVYARILSGEIPIMLDYDFNAYRARYRDRAQVTFVIPAEGSVSFPYVMTMLSSAPHAGDARRFLDFVLSPAGQTLWAESYLRPVLPGVVPEEIASRFLPPSDYARARPLNLQAMAALQPRFIEAYNAQVRGQ